jgi:hypothetical protein
MLRKYESGNAKKTTSGLTRTVRERLHEEPQSFFQSDCCFYTDKRKKTAEPPGKRDSSPKLDRLAIPSGQIPLWQIALNAAPLHQDMSAGWKGKTRIGREGKHRASPDLVVIHQDHARARCCSGHNLCTELSGFGLCDRPGWPRPVERGLVGVIYLPPFSWKKSAVIPAPAI